MYAQGLFTNELYRLLKMALKNVKNIVAVASGKGGVGKSTIATQLCFSLKRLGYQVGLLDADIYGPSVAKMLGATGKKLDSDKPILSQGIHYISMAALTDETSPVVWRAPMATKFIQQFLGQIDWGELDYLVIDCPPGTGDVQITLAQQANLDGAIIVTTPQEVAVLQAQKGLKMFTQVNVPILGVVENMSGFFGNGGGQNLATKEKVDFLGSVPMTPDLVECGEKGTDSHSSIIDSIAAKVVENVAKIKDHIKLTVPTNAHVTEAGMLEIHWPGNHIGLHNPHTLRMNCPCAKCVDENTGKRTIRPDQVPLSIKIQSVGLVGRYALAPKFSDGHQSGLYKFEYLKQLCECDSCLNQQQVSL